MMDNLRAASNNVVLKVILALIIISFVLTGVGNYLIGDAGGYAAKVNGQEISRAQLEQAVQDERSRLQQQLGDQFSVIAGNDGYMKALRKQALSRLIDNTLLDQYVKKLGLTISDEQIKQSILSTPYFMTNNRFDNAKYRSVISQMGLSPDRYAELVRQQLVSQQLIQGYTATGFTLPDEVKSMIALMMQERSIRLAVIDVNALANVQQVTDEELTAYYKQNERQFIAPEQIKVSYIPLDAASVSVHKTITDADIDAYYQKNKVNYAQPGSKNYSVIQLKSDADAKAVVDALRQGVGFAKLAHEKSEDIISRKNGGDIGWLNSDNTPEEIKNANLTEKGQISAPIKSTSGYLVIRLNDVRPAIIKPLSEVRNDVSVALKKKWALDAYYVLQQKVNDAATSDNESLAGAEEAAGVKAKETGWFARGNPPEALKAKPLEQAMFSSDLIGKEGAPGSNSDVINIDDSHAAVLRVTGYKPASVKPLDQVRDIVVNQVKHQKAVAQAHSQGEKLLHALQAGKGNEALQAAGLTFSDAQTITRSSPDRQLADTVFALAQPQQGKSVYGLTQDSKDNTVLLELDSVKAGSLPDNEINVFASQMQTEATGIIFDALMDNLRANAKIKLGKMTNDM